MKLNFIPLFLGLFIALFAAPAFGSHTPCLTGESCLLGSQFNTTLTNCATVLNADNSVTIPLCTWNAVCTRAALCDQLPTDTTCGAEPGCLWSGSLTWNTQPSFDPTSEVTLPGSSLQDTPNYGSKSFDITNLVRGWVNGTYPNYGLVIESDRNYGNAYFYSFEGSIPPRLEINGGTTVINPGSTGEDVLVSEGAPNSYFGGDSNLLVGRRSGTSNRFRSYIKFDLSGVSGLIDNATLYIYEWGQDGDVSPDDFRVHTVTLSWNESLGRCVGTPTCGTCPTTLCIVSSQSCSGTSPACSTFTTNKSCLGSGCNLTYTAFSGGPYDTATVEAGGNLQSLNVTDSQGNVVNYFPFPADPQAIIPTGVYTFNIGPVSSPRFVLARPAIPISDFNLWIIKTKSVAAPPQQLPDLTPNITAIKYVGPGGITEDVPTGSPIVPGARLRIFGELRNIGEEVAHDVHVRELIDGAIINEPVSSVLAGGTDPLPSIDWISQSGNHKIEIIADPDNLVPELNEFNNVATRLLAVLPSGAFGFGAPLQVTTQAPPTAVAGTPFQIFATLKNTAGQTLHNTRAAIDFFGGFPFSILHLSPGEISEKAVGDIAPGAQQTVSWSVFGSGPFHGTFRIKGSSDEASTNVAGIVLVSVQPVVAAAAAAVSCPAGITPNDALFTVDLALERLQLSLPSDVRTQAQLLVGIFCERLSEVIDAVQRGDTSSAQTALRLLRETFSELSSKFEQGRRQIPSAQFDTNEARSLLNSQLATLQQTFAQAQPAQFLSVIEAAIRGTKDALRLLSTTSLPEALTTEISRFIEGSNIRATITSEINTIVSDAKIPTGRIRSMVQLIGQAKQKLSAQSEKIVAETNVTGVRRGIESLVQRVESRRGQLTDADVKSMADDVRAQIRGLTTNVGTIVIANVEKEIRASVQDSAARAQMLDVVMRAERLILAHIVQIINTANIEPLIKSIAANVTTGAHFDVSDEAIKNTVRQILSILIEIERIVFREVDVLLDTTPPSISGLTAPEVAPAGQVTIRFHVDELLSGNPLVSINSAGKFASFAASSGGLCPPAPALNPITWAITAREPFGTSSSGMLSDLDKAVDLGAKIVRLDYTWRDLEPSQDNINQQALDHYRAMTQAARARGLIILAVAATPGGAPQWAKELYIRDKAAFFRQVAEFYSLIASNSGADIKYYQLWNEPNLGSEPLSLAALALPFPTPINFLSRSDSAQLLAVARAAIAANDNDFETVLNLATDPDPRWTDAMRFYLDSAPSSVDIISIDYYPGTWSLNAYENWQPLDDLFSIARAYGKKAAITETGFATPNLPLHGEKEQERWVARALPAMRDKVRELTFSTGVPFVYAGWFSMRDERTGTPNPEDNFGILRTDRASKLAYDDLRYQIRQPDRSTSLIANLPTPTFGCAFSYVYNAISGEEQGRRNLTVAAIDFNGNTGTASRAITIDTRPPRLGPLTLATGTPTKKNSNISFSTSYQDDTSGVAKCESKVTGAADAAGVAGTAAVSAPVAIGSPSSGAASGTLAGPLKDGSYTAEVNCTDAAGNSATASSPLQIDTLPPSVADDYTRSAVPSSTAANITLSGSDPSPSSGVKEVKYCTDSNNSCTPNTTFKGPLSFAEEGKAYLRYQATDFANNTGETKVSIVHIDRTPPVLNISLTAESTGPCVGLFFWAYFYTDGGTVSWPVAHGCVRVSVTSNEPLSSSSLRILTPSDVVAASSTNAPIDFNFETSETNFKISTEAADLAGNTATDSLIVFEDDDGDLIPDIIDACPTIKPVTDVEPRDGCEDTPKLPEDLAANLQLFTGEASTSITQTSATSAVQGSFSRGSKTWFTISSAITGPKATINVNFDVNNEVKADGAERIFNAVPKNITIGGKTLAATMAEIKFREEAVGGASALTQIYNFDIDGGRIRSKSSYSSGSGKTKLELTYQNDVAKSACIAKCAKGDKACPAKCVADNVWSLTSEFAGKRTLSIYDVLAFAKQF